MADELGRIVVLNGTPRSGKTSVARAMQASFDGIWMNLGVDALMAATPEALHPGIGLRPGGERPDLESAVALLFAGLYESSAANRRLGVNVVVDVGHHDSYSRPLGTLTIAARRLTGLSAWLVGVRCPVDVVMARRRTTGTEAPREFVERWEREVHRPGIYDLEVDTSILSPQECAEMIRLAVFGDKAPSAFVRLLSG